MHKLNAKSPQHSTINVLLSLILYLDHAFRFIYRDVDFKK